MLILAFLEGLLGEAAKTGMQKNVNVYWACAILYSSSIHTSLENRSCHVCICTDDTSTIRTEYRTTE